MAATEQTHRRLNITLLMEIYGIYASLWYRKEENGLGEEKMGSRFLAVGLLVRVGMCLESRSNTDSFKV